MDLVDGNLPFAWPDGVDTYTPRQDSVNAGTVSVFRSPASLYNNVMALLIHYQNNLGLRPMGAHPTVQARLDSFIPNVNTFSFVAQQVPTTGGGGNAGYIEYDVGGQLRYVPFSLTPTSTGAESPNVAFIYPNETDRLAQTGYAVQQTDVDLARIFLQADTVPHSAYIAQGTAPGVTWLEFGGGTGAQLSNIAHTYANSGDRTGEVGYPVTATDITLARFFLQSDTTPHSMFIATGTVGNVTWVQVSGPVTAESVIAFDYPDQTARENETGHAVTLDEINNGRLFTQSDSAPARLFRAQGTPGTITWQELGPPYLPDIAFVYPTETARTNETGRPITAQDISLRTLFAQGDTDPYSLWYPTGSVGLVGWQQVSAPPVSDPVIAFVYPTELARTNQTGHTVTQLDVDNRRLFLQADTDPNRLFYATGTAPGVAWQELGSVQDPIIAFEYPSESARLAEAGHPVTATEIARKLLFLETDSVPNKVFIADGTPGAVTWREICCGNDISSATGNLNVSFTSGNGANIQNVQAEVVPTGGGTAIQSTLSTAQGLATFTGLDVGTYNLTTVPATLGAGETVSPTTQVVTIANGVTTNETIEITGVGTGTLNVTYGTSDASQIQGIQAQVVPSGGGTPILSTASDVAGLATFTGLTANNYDLTTVTATLAAGTQATPTTQSVTVLANQTVAANIAVAAVPAGNLDVTYTTSNGATIQGIIAQVVPTGGGATTQSSASSAGGVAQFTSLTPGSYNLTTNVPSLDAGDTVVPTTQVVVIVDATTEMATIDIVDAGTVGNVEVTFTTSSSSTIQGLQFQVELVGGGTPVVSPTSDVAGVATLTGLATGSYDLIPVVGGLDPGDTALPATQVVVVSDGVTTQTTIDIATPALALGGVTAGLRVWFEADDLALGTGNLDVTFVPATSQNIQNINAFLVSLTGGPTLVSPPSDAGGLTSFTNLVAGSYTLSTDLSDLGTGETANPLNQTVVITDGATTPATITILADA